MKQSVWMKSFGPESRSAGSSQLLSRRRRSPSPSRLKKRGSIWGVFQGGRVFSRALGGCM
eukprot:8642154-Pyramimonas_sp.AAC.1